MTGRLPWLLPGEEFDGREPDARLRDALCKYGDQPVAWEIVCDEAGLTRGCGWCCMNVLCSLKVVKLFDGKQKEGSRWQNCVSN